MPTKTYFVDHVNNCRYPLNGVIPSDNESTVARTARSFRKHMVLSATQLPPKVDLRPTMTTIENQWQANSCVANAFAGAYEYLVKKANGESVDVSRLFLYYNARYRSNPWGMISDSGCMLDQAIAALCDYGICLESIWPYDLRYVNARPSKQTYESARDHRIVDWLRLSINVDEMKSCLAQGYPFVFGAELFNSFGQATRSGIVPMPSATELDPSRAWDPNNQVQQHRYHAMLAVGYSDQSQVFIVRNSWGEQWGQKGYCYMPYAYLSNSRFCFDAWAIRKLAKDDFNRESWSYQDSGFFTAEFISESPSEMRTSEPPYIIDIDESENPEEVSDETKVVIDGSTAAVTDDTTATVADDTTVTVIDDTTTTVADDTTVTVIDDTTTTVADDTTVTVIDDPTATITEAVPELVIEDIQQ